MKRVLGTVIVGCAVTAIAVAVSAASANAESFMAAKDGGALIAFGGKDASSMTLGKDGGSAALEGLAVGAKDGGSTFVELAKDGGATFEGLALGAKDGGSTFVEMAKDGGAGLIAYH
jgi:hypothetical protein